WALTASDPYQVWATTIKATRPIRLRFLARPLQALSLRTLSTEDALQEVSRYRLRLPLELIHLFHRQVRALMWLTTGSIAHRRLCCRPMPRRAVRVCFSSRYYPKRIR